MLIEQSVLKGRYRIAHPMEEGGYGKVYRAYDQGLKIDVAIKETLYEHADFVKGFQREAEMLAPLQHEALPKVFDTFTLADQAYIVMRYIEGENLGDYLKRQAERRVDVSTALTIVLPVLDALEYLHSQQPSPIIHRDIKPSNIRLTPDENVFLVDFGISRASDTTTSTTSTPRAMTAGFSPIEQYEQDDPVDERSDIYALGATLYYMLTGFVPHAAASRINVDPVSPLHEVENSISPRISEVVAKMMAIRAADRYQSINEVREALTTVATPAPKIVPAPRDTAPPSRPEDPDSPFLTVAPVSESTSRETTDTIFALRQHLVHDYHSYISSFLQIRDPRIRQRVSAEMRTGTFWPDPLIQLNPAFASGARIDQLVEKNILHPECMRIFRKGKDRDQGELLQLHQHQRDAIEVARGGHNYVLTTGTGSGKSLAYIVPIVDYVLRNNARRGIQAIIVYPMNALANSQYRELYKFLCEGYSEHDQRVTFKVYTGQESEEEKQSIIQNPPHILLTNYVMLELILTRPKEEPLVAAAQGLRFLVLDELHTYRGRQGADVAMLVRRVRDRLSATALQCIGTSATLASGGTYEEQRAEIAEVATQLFGTTVEPTHIISETLQRITLDRDITDLTFVGELTSSLTTDPLPEPPQTFDDFIKHPLSIWIERTLGVTVAEGEDRLVRAQPRSITGERGAASLLRQLTGVPEETCAAVLQHWLLASYHEAIRNPTTDRPPFAFRLHQFISRGDTVYATLEPEEDRYITLQGQYFQPGESTVGESRKVLFPLVFCRECGQAYARVWMVGKPQSDQFAVVPRTTNQQEDTAYKAGFVYINTREPWPIDQQLVNERLPDNWVEEHRDTLRVRRHQRQYVPVHIMIGPDGKPDPHGLSCHYIEGDFRFCLQCGITYGGRQTSEFAKLATLGSEGRSTATTILSLATIRHLDTLDVQREARKLLSFTDNRQDASLQAGHFNDFIEIGLLRGALYRAVRDAGPEGLGHDVLAQKVFDALDVPLDMYAVNPSVRFRPLEDTKQALRGALGYRLYRDLRRGWRITSPNLEQCGLLEMHYLSLNEVCEAADIWSSCHPVLVEATPKQRKQIAKVLLDHMRRELAIKVDYLDPKEQGPLLQRSNQHLKAPWALDEDERSMTRAKILYPRSAGDNQDSTSSVYLSAYGGFGQYLRRRDVFGSYEGGISRDNTQQIIRELLAALEEGGLVERVVEQAQGSRKRRTARTEPTPPDNANDVPGYQLLAAAMRWVAGDGSRVFHDPIRVPRQPTQGGHTNRFFVDFYKSVSVEDALLDLRAAEHTAQVPSEDRIQREQRFREAELPILYCSPTMELGVDIAELNVVSLRNMPPTPANYAQRSGRAGRSGQPALVFTYCSTGSSHDQYFFRRPSQMVSGAVSAPRLDLTNEDMLRSHMHAIWLAETQADLGETLVEVLSVADKPSSLAVKSTVQEILTDSGARKRAQERAEQVLSSIKDALRQTDWFYDTWLDDVLDQGMESFDAACQRWRDLYRAALTQANVQHQIVQDASRSTKDKEQAQRLRREAEDQLRLLTEVRSAGLSDFYSYRYFASEGFLPGYNFPRLPLSAYIEGRRGAQRDDFLSRSRFLAITEFGPRALVYHEGSRYIINRVIRPVEPGAQLPTSSAKLCPSCGYLHFGEHLQGADVCERCNARLEPPLHPLFRLQNVGTRRRDRINSDEEERMRLGYEVITAVRFSDSEGRTARRTTEVLNGDEQLGKLDYGNAATIWRINLGWLRRKNYNDFGFVLDTERGYWKKDEQTADDADDPTSKQALKVIPYVQDRRNCLLFEPACDFAETSQRIAFMVSLQAALKQAIQVVYQLEDNELAVELLPTDKDPKLMLLYESTEGGAGVLRHLMDDPQALARVAREALHICHFDPDTGKDYKRAPHAQEDCEAACYDCLMTYVNQRYHARLDRQCIKDFLLELIQAHVPTPPVPQSRKDQLGTLMAQVSTDIEQRWLEWLSTQRCRLPTHVHYAVQGGAAQVDFFYDEQQTIVYVDGAPDDHPDRQGRDAEQMADLEENLGVLVLRFGAEATWEDLVKQNQATFGGTA